MALQVMCPNLRCRKILAIPDDARGKVVKCQYCQTLLRAPGARSPHPNTPAAPAGAKG